MNFDGDAACGEGVARRLGADRRLKQFLRMCRDFEKKPQRKDTEVLVTKLTEILENCAESSSEAVAALKNLIKSQPENAGEFLELLFCPTQTTLLQRLEGGVDANKSNDELRICLIQCLDVGLACLLETQLPSELAAICNAAGVALLGIFFHHLQAISTEKRSILLLSALTLLHKITSLCPSFAETHAPELFGISKTFLGYGRDGSTVPAQPERVKLSQQALRDVVPPEEDAAAATTNDERGSRGGGKRSKMRKPKNIAKGTRRQLEATQSQCFPVEGPVAQLLGLDYRTSDSDASEPDTPTDLALKEHYRAVKVRLAAVTLLGVVARSLDRRTIYGYWHALLPNWYGGDSRDLLDVAATDPNVRCRSSALQVVMELLCRAQSFLSLAESVECPENFMPFGHSLALMLAAMYRSLASIIGGETSLPVLVQTLKCLAVLVKATPWHRLNIGFPENLAYHLRALVVHRDVTVQVAALMVIEFMLAIPQLPPKVVATMGLPRFRNKNLCMNHQSNDAAEMIEVPSSEEEEEEHEEVENEESVTTQTDSAPPPMSWLLKRVLENLTRWHQGSRESTALRMESLGVLSVMAGHFPLVGGHLSQVGIALQISLTDPSPDIRLYAARCLVTCLCEIGRNLAESSRTARMNIKSCTQFWLSLEQTVTEHMRHKQPAQAALRVTLCDALSNIGVVLFERSPQGQQLNLMTLLTGVCSDDTEDTLVRASALRALAVLVLYPSLRENLVFLENVAELALRLVDHAILPVRIKVSWSIGNVSDALVSNADGNCRERITEDLLLRLIEAAIAGCTAHDKVRCNAVRTLGNLMFLFDASHFADEVRRKLFLTGVNKLIDCISAGGNAKAKWNACYAVKQFLRNRALFEATKKHSQFAWQDILYPTLCRVIVNHQNFKVRTNAAMAIGTLTDRTFYGSHFEAIWNAVLTAVEESNHLNNFREYNHQDQLQLELCFVISSMLRAARPDDYSMLQDHLLERVDVIRTTFLRVVNRSVPGKVVNLVILSSVLPARLADGSVSSMEQRSALNFICETFHVESF